MRVNPISTNRYYKSCPVNFGNKHSSMKRMGKLFGGIALVSGTIGTIVLSGGISLPFIIAYTAIGTAGGMALGHSIDKGAKEFDEKEKAKLDKTV